MTEKKAYVKNASDEKQVKEAKRKEKDVRAQELEDIKFVLSSPQGRRFYWRYLSKCGMFTTSFTGNSGTYFKEGERNVGLRLYADMMAASPDSYLLMIKENKK